MEGDRIQVRTRYGWAFEGELRQDNMEGIRIFDPTIDEIVKLERDDVVELAVIDTDSTEKK